MEDKIKLYTKTHLFSWYRHVAVLKKKKNKFLRIRKNVPGTSLPPRHAGTGLGKHLSPFDQEILVLDRYIWKCLIHRIKMNNEHYKHGFCSVTQLTQTSDVN